MTQLSRDFMVDFTMLLAVGVLLLIALSLGLPLWAHWWDVIKEYWRIS